MTEQYVGEHFNSSDIVEVIKKEKDVEVVKSGYLVDVVPQDMGVIHDTSPVGGIVAEDTSMDKVIAPEASTDETIMPVHGDNSENPNKAPMGVTLNHDVPVGVNYGSLAALLNRDQSGKFRARWNEIQGKFVDEPQTAVQEADLLVTEVIEQVTQMFTQEHKSLESLWKQGSEVSTEDLRKALQHYRFFFNRLVV